MTCHPIRTPLDQPLWLEVLNQRESKVAVTKPSITTHHLIYYMPPMKDILYLNRANVLICYQYQ